MFYIIIFAIIVNGLLLLMLTVIDKLYPAVSYSINSLLFKPIISIFQKIKL